MGLVEYSDVLTTSFWRGLEEDGSLGGEVTMEVLGYHFFGNAPEKGFAELPMSIATTSLWVYFTLRLFVSSLQKYTLSPS